jgi:hypothetical protein
MLRRLVALSLLLLAACEEPPAATLSEVPGRFTGMWAANLADCEVGGGALAVSVDPVEVRFPDSRLAVTGVAPDGDSAVRVSGHYTGPGTEWDGSVRLELGDGVLSVVNGLPVVPRVKCP